MFNALILISTTFLFNYFNECLQKEIFAAQEKDQLARYKIIEALNGSLENQIPAEIEASIGEIDRGHNRLIRETIQQYGWPGISLVGKEGSNAFWLLVQHQDRDLELQMECLRLLDEAVQKGEASREDLAFLIDRVRKNQGGLQLYGTQWKTENGKLVLHPVEDPEALDQRRMSMGLSSMEEYKSSLMEGLKLSNH